MVGRHCLAAKCPFQTWPIALCVKTVACWSMLAHPTFDYCAARTFPRQSHM